MEKNIKKYSLEEFPTLIATVCNSMASDDPDDDLLQTCAQIIYDLLGHENVTTLINFWNDNVSEDVTLITKAVMYECLYIIYSSFNTATDAYRFLTVLSDTI